MANLISASLSDEANKRLLCITKEMKEILSFGLKLTKSEKKKLPKMDDERLPFVEKSIQFGKQEPAIVPPYTDLDELSKDLDLYKDLKTIEYEIRSLAEMVIDTRIAAGSDAYVAALSIYNSSKGAAKMGVPGSDSIADELKRHFEQKRSNTSSEEEEE